MCVRAYLCVCVGVFVCTYSVGSPADGHILDRDGPGVCMCLSVCVRVYADSGRSPINGHIIDRRGTGLCVCL